VEYQLTEDGRRLKPVVEVMREFGLWLKTRPELEPENPELAAVEEAQAVVLLSDA
jgi:DNA-binding HxlR family transcriptional regulator